jgi:hypothetical protein
MKITKIAAALLLLSLIFILSKSGFAWDDRYQIKRKSSSNSFGSGSADIEMRKKYDYNPLNKYRGTIDSDGSVRMRDYKGNTLRGTIDEDGRGRLRDQDGNYYRVKPKW